MPVSYTHLDVYKRQEEIAFLESFGGAKQVVEMSQGVIEHSQVKVTSGPLQGKEGYIRKIDRHKRKAWLDIEMFGRTQNIQVGLEIVAKIESVSYTHLDVYKRQDFT